MQPVKNLGYEMTWNPLPTMQLCQQLKMVSRVQAPCEQDSTEVLGIRCLFAQKRHAQHLAAQVTWKVLSWRDTLLEYVEREGGGPALLE